MSALVFPTPFGVMALAEENGAIVRLYLPGEEMPPSEETGTLLRDGRVQLLEYLEGRRRAFSLPLAPRGTAFRQSVWKALLEIPYGETLSYGALAYKLARPSASRAVGGANHHNPIPILIPCHRVVGAKGALTGYAGGLALKERLLALESAVVRGDAISGVYDERNRNGDRQTCI